MGERLRAPPVFFREQRELEVDVPVVGIPLERVLKRRTGLLGVSVALRQGPGDDVGPLAQGVQPVGAFEVRESPVGVRPRPHAPFELDRRQARQRERAGGEDEEHRCAAEHRCRAGSFAGGFARSRSRKARGQPQQGERGGPERGDLPQPVDRAVDEPVDAGCKRSCGDGGAERVGLLSTGQGGGERRRHEAEEERAADEAGLGEGPQREAVRVERLLARGALPGEVDCEVVDAHAEQGMVGDFAGGNSPHVVPTRLQARARCVSERRRRG